MPNCPTTSSGRFFGGSFATSWLTRALHRTGPTGTARHCEQDIGRDYARALLAALGIAAAAIPERAPEHPALTWAKSGAMALTGRADEPARICPVPLASYADGAIMALAAIAERPLPANLNGARLLGERAAIAGYTRNGSSSAGGSCRFLETADGWIALNLARDDDWQSVPALVQRDIPSDWPALIDAVRAMEADALIAQGRQLGLAIARHGFPNAEHAPPLKWPAPLRTSKRRSNQPLVIELASLWAGPLCGHLLQLSGARVVKVESIQRPDGSRFGPPDFHHLLNAGKESVALDFSTGQGRDRLRALIARADIVIEGSRPRALRQLGISAEDSVAGNPGLVWLSITGYGRGADAANWIAFGDDAGVSAGLSAFLSPSAGAPIFCGDAIADPLTGLHAAVIALSQWRRGASGLFSVPLRDIVGHCIAFDGAASAATSSDRAMDWQSFLDARAITPTAPVARTPSGFARPLGADTSAALRELGIAC